MSSEDLRVIFVGNSQVGKTALMNRYVDGEFSSTEQTTVNPIFTPKSATSASSKEIMMQLWDTAGQERFQSLSQVFYRDAHLAVICVDLSEPSTIDTISLWKERVLAHEPSCALIAVGTKLDLVFSENRTKVLSQLSEKATECQISSYYVTSSKTGEGIEDLFTQIATLGEDILSKKVNNDDGNKSVRLDDQQEGKAKPPTKPFDNCCK
ncbi:Ras family protein [Trichomonas vaginalis G3]|uniref:Ras family protein n=1 Tax=Trichomonas vaginalis (strain ATCC PRA-98 / G3) TaxID=412133 RepID=A2EQ49_TRIV3|nr:GTPase protein [Trichomonas vaginalis G3]EAY05224.1 Ras family protein [Trichomonas vaginalis G3]KAI5542609.1 GTPase protein [Trichomonas vaginalis G3]|eukprot:XP_001317447.1 Ras family protein [Trichomonas vaginalis G3]